MAQKKSAPIERPLSPHLTIYRPQITTVLSITHRATGIFLVLGAFILSLWLISLANGPESYRYFVDFISSSFGRVLMVGWTFSLFFHLCNGIRHMFWDIGLGFELVTVTASGILVIIVSVVVTLIVWNAALLGL